MRTKNWVEINDDAGGTYNTNSQIKFKTLILKSNLYDYNDVYLLVSGTITVGNTGKAAASNNRKNVIIKNCAPFSGCISEIRNTQIDNAKDNIIKYSDNLKKNQEVHGNTTEMNQLYIIIAILSIFLLIIIAVLGLNLKQK